MKKLIIRIILGIREAITTRALSHIQGKIEESIE